MNRILKAIFCLSCLSALTAPSGAAIVQATYEITASGFTNSNGNPPSPPTSTSVGGTVTFTFDADGSVQNELPADSMTGFDIVDGDGELIDYDTTNSGVNAAVSVSQGFAEITVGGLQSGVAFMVGLSDDFRVEFRVSLSAFSVNSVTENFSFVTTADPFLSAETTTVELVSAMIVIDTDQDGLSDGNDNCVLIANVDQRDTNGDGIGNLCDPDFDQSCVVNFADLATMKANFFSSGDLDTDLDGDGVTNFIDLNVMKTYFFGTPGPGLPGSCP